MFELSLGIFIGVSIISFLTCLFDRDIRHGNYRMSEKILASITMGGIIGTVSAICETIIYFVDKNAV